MQAQLVTRDGITGIPPYAFVADCLCCKEPADHILIRVSFCRCHASIRYGLCEACRDTYDSENCIEAAMLKEFESVGECSHEVWMRLLLESTGHYEQHGWL
jgi:hypothetical protein